MAEVKIVDIDGSQWNMKDQVARDKIAELEEKFSVQDLADIDIELKPGYTATQAKFINHYKVGKIHFMAMRLDNIAGDKIGTEQTANIGLINIRPRKDTYFLLNDYKNNKTLRCFIANDGTIAVGESGGIISGNNICLGELIFAEV